MAPLILVISGSGNGLSSKKRQAITWTNADLLAIPVNYTIVTNSDEVLFQNAQNVNVGPGIRTKKSNASICTSSPAVCRVQVISLILDSSLSRFVSGHSACWRFGVWDPGFQSCIQQKKTSCLLSIRNLLACTRTSKLTTTNMYGQRNVHTDNTEHLPVARASWRHQWKHVSSTSLALCEKNPPATGVFPSQRAIDAERCPISWRHDSSSFALLALFVLHNIRSRLVSGLPVQGGHPHTLPPSPTPPPSHTIHPTQNTPYSRILD